MGQAPKAGKNLGWPSIRSNLKISAESKLASKPYLESLSIASWLYIAARSSTKAVSKSQDPVLVDYLMQFFHNIEALLKKSL